MSLKKYFDDVKQICKVTFTLSKDTVKSAHQISIAGDFNNWDFESIPMRKNKAGEFSASVDLKQGREYQFKYRIDGNKWLNEPDADMYVSNVFCSDNSVVIV